MNRYFPSVVGEEDPAMTQSAEMQFNRALNEGEVTLFIPSCIKQLLNYRYTVLQKSPLLVEKPCVINQENNW